MTDNSGNGFNQYKRLYEARFQRIDDTLERIEGQLALMRDQVANQQTVFSIARWAAVTLVAGAVSWAVNRLSR